MKNIFYFLPLSLLMYSCSKKPYLTYEKIAENHKKVFEHFAQDPGIIDYQGELKTNQFGSTEKDDFSTRKETNEKLANLEKHFNYCFFDTLQAHSRDRKQQTYRVKRALEVLSEQRKSYINMEAAEKTELSNFILNASSVWIREIDLPFSDYDHVSSPYKNKSLVFYHFDSFNPETGFGIYHQTNAFYLRDAYDLSMDSIRAHKRVEYFCAPFFVQKTSNGMQLHLLSPANELIERKVFEIVKYNDTGDKTSISIANKNTGTKQLNYELFKKYEFKLANDFPFNLGSYKLQWYPDYDQFREDMKKKLGGIYNSGIVTKNNQTKADERVNEFNELSEDALKNMDFMYPIKTEASISEKETGWIYFGRIYIDKNRFDTLKNTTDTNAAVAVRELRSSLNKGMARADLKSFFKSKSILKRKMRMISLKDETFYRKSKLVFIPFNNEIENLWRLLRKETHIQPLEIVYLRSDPGKNVNNIIGEVSPYKIYEVESLHLNGDHLWLKVKDIGHERTCPDCTFKCTKQRKNGECKKYNKKCDGKCRCHGATP